MNLTKLIYTLPALIFGISEAQAQTCTAAPSCAELGFTNTVASCVDGEMIKCPFDQSKVFCRSVKSCESLGFDKTTTQCSGKKISVCPSDAAKVSCDESVMIGEIKLWSGTSIPKGWRICDGASLSTTTYSQLYAVIGTTFGGYSGYFYLPDFKGRAPVGIGYATNSSYTYSMGSKGGEEMHYLSISEIPSHNHNIQFGAWKWGDNSNTRPFPQYNGGDTFNSQTQYTGGGAAHENRMPYLAIYYIIYTGVY